MDAGNHDTAGTPWKPYTGPFERTADGLVGLFVRWLPPQPPRQRVLKTSWRDAFYYSSWQTIAAAVGMLAVVITAIAVLQHFTVMRISILSFAVGLLKTPVNGFHGTETFAPPMRSSNGGNGSATALWLQLLGTALVMIIGRWLLRKIPEFALKEEQEFREGCEDWSSGERVKACAIFGAAHLNNLWYPLASVIALSVGGGIFMWWYLSEYRRSHDREMATNHAAGLHAIYNGIVVSVIAFSILLALWY